MVGALAVADQIQLRSAYCAGSRGGSHGILGQGRPISLKQRRSQAEGIMRRLG